MTKRKWLLRALRFLDLLFFFLADYLLLEGSSILEVLLACKAHEHSYSFV